MVLQINTGAPPVFAPQIFAVLGKILYVVDFGLLKVFEVFYTVTQQISQKTLHSQRQIHKLKISGFFSNQRSPQHLASSFFIKLPLFF